jgi:2',3'-cyclic-nucleotide 2'-phosphodiesterase/3'-nucleotidase/5'-nucleotidase
MIIGRRTLISAALVGPVAAWIGTASAVHAFEPVNELAPTAPIRLSVLGTYRGNVYSENTPPAPPVYDPGTRQLVVGSVDRDTVEVLDISHPVSPRMVATVDLERYGVPFSLGLDEGLLAVAIRNPDQQIQHGQVLLFRLDVERLEMVAEPISLPAPGDMAFTPDGRRLVVLLPGPSDADYVNDPDAGIAIIDIGRGDQRACRRPAARCDVHPTVRIVDFRRFNGRKAALIATGLRIYGPNNPSVSQDINPEEIAISRNSRRAWVTLQTNNAIAEIDIEHAKVTRLLPLGTKNHRLRGNGFDASDRDGRINIRTWPVDSLYMPDQVAAIEQNGQTFLLTANEGDPKDYDVYSEKIRIGDPAYVLDPRRFPDAALLKQESRLGRLQATKVDGDTDGDYDRIILPGSRSFVTAVSLPPSLAGGDMGGSSALGRSGWTHVGS